MASPKKTARPSVLILHPPNEVRHPYDVSLLTFCEHTEWLTSYTALLNETPEKYSTVVIDLDCVGQPLELKLQQIRTHFSESDLIGLSSSDSSQMALQVIRSGFCDFLLKPTSPEELSWCIRKNHQKKALLQRLSPKDPFLGLVRVVTQISSCYTPSLVRLYTLEYLKIFFNAEGAAWLIPSEDTPEQFEVVAALPKKLERETIFSHFRELKEGKESPGHAIIQNSRTVKKRRLLLRTQGESSGSVILWGTGTELNKKNVSQASILLEHSEVSLLHIQKIDELKQQTFVDDLTGLYNSRFLKFAVTNAILRCKKPEHRFSVLFIDLDHFKNVNDENGHVVGSEFLVAIGKTIKNAVRAIDPVFRYGGDEFVVILNETNTTGAIEIAERIRKNIERRVFVVQGQQLRATVSIGLATYPDHASDKETLLKLADEAMYNAKKASRNAVHLAVTGKEVKSA